ncbi:hypothetical protein [Paenibacillus humicola]|uniref:hypothetical protein n=1 Tax=Paenibacillus humicola TaxID=3110540 RepID=UPI00237C453A|nr:hypothetical protein [Paenibacillus humicola]
MFTLEEKRYLLKILKREGWMRLFRFGRKDAARARLVEKLEQMIRNESVNRDFL